MRIVKMEEITGEELVEMVRVGGVSFLSALIISHRDVVIKHRKAIYNYAKGAKNKMMMKVLERQFKDLRPKPLVRMLSKVLQCFGFD